MDNVINDSFCLPEDYMSDACGADISDCVDALNAALIRADAVLTVLSLCHADPGGDIPSAKVLVEALWSVSGNVEQAKKLLTILMSKVRPCLRAEDA